MTPLASIVSQAAERPEVRQGVADIYAKLQEAIDLRKPICVLSGRCCHFEEFGHRLFVTTLELAAFVHEFLKRPKSPALSSAIAAWDGRGCPFQIAGLCGVHAFKPLGCRMFFCDATSTAWQAEQYEKFHGDLKRLHEELDVPYRYIEWRQAIEELKLTL